MKSVEIEENRKKRLIFFYLFGGNQKERGEKERSGKIFKKL
jgi:hypothetical protein